MTSVRKFFDRPNPYVNPDRPNEVTYTGANETTLVAEHTISFDVTGEESKRVWHVLVRCKVHLDYAANAIHSHLYISETEESVDLVQMCQQLVLMGLNNPSFNSLIASYNISFRTNDADGYKHSDRLVNTRHLIIYVEASMSEQDRQSITDFAWCHNSVVLVRDLNFARPQQVLEEEQQQALAAPADGDATDAGRPQTHTPLRVHLGRSTSDTILIVEGEDKKFLEVLSLRLRPGTATADILDAEAVYQSGGWGGWQKVLALAELCRREGRRVYCLFDSDYHTPQTIRGRYDAAAKAGVQLHIWQRKEIENYFLSPSLIARVIQVRRPSREVTPAEIQAQIEAIIESQKMQVLGNISAHLQKSDRISMEEAPRQALQRVEEAWQTSETRISIVSGKEVLSQLSRWAQEKYGSSFSPSSLAHAAMPDDLPAEIKQVVDALADRTDFPAELPADWM